MVLIAATVCTKSGKALVSRQFVEMTKARIEGLLAAFPKLMTGGRQHTFVETESVRYVYQPLDKLYMLLITTKASNILEDLETLRLFSRVVPEYCTQLTEAEILNQAFNLLFAFDEIVALGYRESVNLAQVRSFVEMDSHEEKIYQAVRQTQEREAANRMRERAKELQRERLEAAKRGQPPRSQMSFGSGGFGSSGGSSNPSEPIAEKIPTTPARETARPAGRSAMKLGSRGADADSFVSRLRSEGEPVPNAAVVTAAGVPEKVVNPNHNDVHLRFEERLSLVAGRDGDIQNFELSGLLTLRITNEQFGKIRVHVDNKDTRPLQLQTHPNVDKESFRSGGVIGLKQRERPFPMHSDVGVLKWRLASTNVTDDKLAPLSVNCWPSEGASGGCDVNIEYELQQEHLSLSDVNITIPLPSGNVSLVVHQWEGSYAQKGRSLVWSIPIVNAQQKTKDPSGNVSLVVHQWEGSYAQKGRSLVWSVPIVNAQQKTKAPYPSGNVSLVVHQWEGSYAQKGRTLVWSVPIVNAQQKTGSLEFTVTPAIPNDFFPLSVTWTSDTSMAMLKATRVSQAEDGSPVDFSQEISFHPDKYEIV